MTTSRRDTHDAQHRRQYETVTILVLLQFLYHLHRKLTNSWGRCAESDPDERPSATHAGNIPHPYQHRSEQSPPPNADPLHPPSNIKYSHYAVYWNILGVFNIEGGGMGSFNINIRGRGGE